MSAAINQPAPLMQTTGWLASANVLRNLGLLVVLLALTRFSTEGAVGRYAIALAITTPTFAFAQMGLRGVFLTHRKTISLASYILVQAAAAAAACLVSTVVGVVIDARFGVTVALVSVFKAADAFSEFFTGPLQQLDRARLVFWGFACSAVAGGAIVVVSLVIWANLDLALIGLALTNIAVMVTFFALPVVRSVQPTAGLGGLSGFATVVKAGLPIGLALSVFALVLTLPQYFLAASHGEAAVGAFAVLFYIYAAGDLFTGTLALAWMPHARQVFEKATRPDFNGYLRRTVLRWSSLYLPLSGAGFALAYFVYPVIFPGYVLGGDVIAPLACSILLLPALHFLSAAISVRNLYAHNLTMGAFAAVASLTACIVLIPNGGIVGAFWAVTLGIAARNVTAAFLLAVDRSSERGKVKREPQP